MIVRHDDWAAHLAALVASFFPAPLSTLAAPRGGHDQDSDVHRTLYASLDGRFLVAYDVFIGRVLDHLERRDWVVQAVPTFRVQAPGQAGTDEWHVDRDYGHPPQTVNVVVPCTPMADSTAIWLEDAPYSGHFAPMPATTPGDYIVFDGANRKHGTVTNRTTSTRVSFDFRLLPRESLPPAGTTTKNRRVPLAMGAYYREVSR
jgi:ectoine hydroxylase-related dioxygenase (phytanoyl-CoA dioxygenase family)